MLTTKTDSIDTITSDQLVTVTGGCCGHPRAAFRAARLEFRAARLERRAERIRDRWGL